MKLGNRFGNKSLDELDGVHPDMIMMTTAGLILCSDRSIDFSVFDGIRTLPEQKEYVRTGVSWTLKSQHLVQSSGYGHAVDLVPYINGKLRFDAIDALKVIGECMKIASAHYGFPMTWGALKKYGGDWSRRNDMYHFELKQSIYL